LDALFPEGTKKHHVFLCFLMEHFLKGAEKLPEFSPTSFQEYVANYKD